MGSVYELHADPGAGEDLEKRKQAGNILVRISPVMGDGWGEAASFGQMVEVRGEGAEACWILCLSHRDSTY